jgi:predicted transcriptional regulator
VITHVQRDDVAGRPVIAVTLCGKELQVDDQVGAARALLARKPVKIVPVLDGSRYVGAVDASVLGGAAEEAAIEAFTTDLVPVATADTSVDEALGLLDVTGGQRLVVLGPDRERYVGVVCLRGDRRRLCVDTERLGLTGRDVAASGCSSAPSTGGVSG